MLSIIAVAQDTLHQDINVVLLGDSNTWLGGDDCTKPKGWNTYFKQEFNPKSCTSYARSGATWTHTKSTRNNPDEYSGSVTDCNVIYNQAVRLWLSVQDSSQARPNLIIIAAGTNDGWFPQKRPGVFDVSAQEALSDSNITHRQLTEFTSLAQSVVLNCRMLSELFPGCRIVLLTPMQSTAVPLERITRIGDIIEQCGNGLGIPVIRQDKISKVVSANERRAKKYTYDGTHTSVLGAQENGRLIALKINELLQQE